MTITFKLVAVAIIAWTVLAFIVGIMPIFVPKPMAPSILMPMQDYSILAEIIAQRERLLIDL